MNFYLQDLSGSGSESASPPPKMPRLGSPGKSPKDERKSPKSPKARAKTPTSPLPPPNKEASPIITGGETVEEPQENVITKVEKEGQEIGVKSDHEEGIYDQEELEEDQEEEEEEIEEEEEVLLAPDPSYWYRRNPLANEIFITDVTANTVTVTIRECKTMAGFFKTGLSPDENQNSRSSIK